MSYARSRLWLGISCVGSLVVLAVIAIAMDLPSELLLTESAGVFRESVSIICFLGTIALILLPFDLFGGFILPQIFQRKSEGMLSFLKHYGKGVGLQLLVFTGAFLLYRRLGTTYGTVATVAVFALLQVVLITMQAALAKLVGGLGSSKSHREPNANVFVTKATDSGFTGGIAGLPGFETTVLPDLWMQKLPEKLWGAEVRHRDAAISSGSRRKGLIVAVAWNTACFSAALLMPGGGTEFVASIATSYLYFLLFSFIGLLILPTFSRRGVFEVDRIIAAETSSQDVVQLATEIDRLGDSEPSRSTGLESVFHPVPCVKRRADALTSQNPVFGGAWNAARTALFLSWAFGGPLSRAVHCNIGRPELWVLLPTD